MIKKKIILFGAGGMAGHVAFLSLKQGGAFDIIPVVFRHALSDEHIVLDVRNQEAVAQFIRSSRADYIVNCVGVLVQGSANHPDNAILLNSYFPHLLARLADDIQAKLIHISTDCVFSGKKGSYAENDFKDADDTYGRSKALGEIYSVPHVTLRTSIIGPEIKNDGEGLFHWFMHQQGQIKGYTEAYWGGVTTIELARAIRAAIDHHMTGLCHVTNGEKISKYHLLQLFREVWEREDIDVSAYEGKKVDKSLQVSSRFDFNIPGYQDMLKEQKKWMDDYRDIYETIYPIWKKSKVVK